MKIVLKFGFTLLVLGLGSTYFNQYISIDTFQTLIIASLLMLAFDMVYALILLVSAFGSIIIIGCLPLIIGLLTFPFLSLIKLWILDQYLTGFALQGIWSYIILGICLPIFDIFFKSEKEKNTELKSKKLYRRGGDGEE